MAPLLSKATLQKMRVKLDERARLRRQRARREAQQVSACLLFLFFSRIVILPAYFGASNLP